MNKEANNTVMKRDEVSVATTEKALAETKKEARFQCAILSKLEDTSKSSYLEDVAQMTGDEKFARQFVTYAKLAIKNHWKRGPKGEWENRFNLIPMDKIFEALNFCANRRVMIDGHHASLVPRLGKNPTAQVMVSYQGLIDTAAKEGIIEDCWAMEVRENDIIELSFGQVSRFDVDPKKTRGSIIGCVAFADLPNGKRKSVYLNIDELEQIRECAETDNVWGTWLVEMYKKSAIRRLFKTMQTSPKIRALMDVDNNAFDLEKGKRGAGKVINGDGSPVQNLFDDEEEAIEAEASIVEDGAPDTAGNKEIDELF